MIDSVSHQNHATDVSSSKRGLSLASCVLCLVALFGSARDGLQARQDAPPVTSPPSAFPPASLPSQPTRPFAEELVPPPPVTSSPAVPPPPPVAQQAPPQVVDPSLPIKDLLPPAPKVVKIQPMTSNDLGQVPELKLHDQIKTDNPVHDTSFMLAKINHLNSKERDGFLKALLAERKDLVGLPFAMGDACRTKGERNQYFAQAVETVREALSPNPQIIQVGGLSQIVSGARHPQNAAFAPPPTVPAPAPAVESPQPLVSVARVEVQTNTRAANFWTRYQTSCDQQDVTQARADKEQCEHIKVARIAALMQILGPESASLRLGLVKHLSAIAHVEATHALARLTLFAAEDEVRLAAVAALEVRRERDYTDLLVSGLRYPWPQVARNAADAIIRLKRTDLVPQLIAVLEDADPRAPLVREIGTNKVTVVNEMVRINHHRNCAMCHAPGTNNDVPAETLTAGIPMPNEALSGPTGGYNRSRADVLVRLDVTYLRQDFSLMQPVADANPWPEMQRFDFLVRTRPLDADEIAAYKVHFGKNDPSRPSPYQKAALTALRELTGRDTAPTGEAWRKLLDLPAPQGEKPQKEVKASGAVAQLP